MLRWLWRRRAKAPPVPATDNPESPPPAVPAADDRGKRAPAAAAADDKKRAPAAPAADDKKKRGVLAGVNQVVNGADNLINAADRVIQNVDVDGLNGAAGAGRAAAEQVGRLAEIALAIANNCKDRAKRFYDKWHRAIWTLAAVFAVAVLAITISAIASSTKSVMDIVQPFIRRNHYDRGSSMRHLLLGDERIECRASVKSWEEFMDDLHRCSGDHRADSRQFNVRRTKAITAEDGVTETCPSWKDSSLLNSASYKSFKKEAFPPQPGVDRQTWCCELVPKTTWPWQWPWKWR